MQFVECLISRISISILQILPILILRSSLNCFQLLLNLFAYMLIHLFLDFFFLFWKSLIYFVIVKLVFRF